MIIELIEAHLEWKQLNQGRSANTARQYRGHLLRLVDYCQEIQRDPLAVSRDDLEVFTGLYLHKKGLSPVARQTVVAAVRGFYQWLVRAGQLQTNPAAQVPYPKRAKKLPVPLALDAAQALMWAPDMSTFLGVRDAAILAVLIGCGLRVTGLVSLNESDLRPHREDGQDKLILRVTEKGEKDRYLPIPDEASLLLRAYLGHEELDGIDRALPSGDRVLFVSTRNHNVAPHQYYGEKRRISVYLVKDIILKYGTPLGIPRDQLHPHAFRHLYGKELAEADVDILTRQALMGHEDPKSTEIYSHLALRKLAGAVDRANPLAKIKTPVTELLQSLKR
ncbi:MAG: tyrosine-type recombinase/integrase [Pseudomonadota bacterium]